MTYTFTTEQEEFRRSVRRYLESRSPVSEVRRLMETPRGYDEEVWRQLADQLALQGLHVPEEYGGQGFTFVELVIVLEEMGRTLFCAPYLASTCLATNAVLNAGAEDQKRHLLGRLASGQAIGTLACTESDGRWEADAGTTIASADGYGWCLDGVKTYVLDGLIADLVLVSAHADDRVALFVVDGDAAGMQRTELPTMDQTRKQARIEFSGVRAELLGDLESGRDALARTLDTAAVCLSAEMLGGAQRCLEMAVDYAKTRYQFGRPIGSFQAVKHKCADMLVDVESARAAVHHAARALADGDDDIPAVASFTKAYCSDVYFRTAAENIQIHGGIGFTWEHDAHLYFKRAKTSGVLLGDSTYHRELLAGRLGV